MSQIKSKSKLDVTAEKLLAIVEKSMKPLPAKEQEARWKTFTDSASSLETRAKAQVRLKAPSSPRVAPKRA